jgi:hypothetical protein
MGDFQPLAHVNGSLGWSLMALMSSSLPAGFFFMLSMLMYLFVVLLVAKVSI